MYLTEYLNIETNPAYIPAAVTFSSVLLNKGITFMVEHIYDGFKWTFPEYDCDGDGVIHMSSYGNSIGCIETIGFPWDEDDVSEHPAAEAACMIATYLSNLRKHND